MSKKVVQDVPVKKKKHGCRNCFFAVLIFVVVVNVAAFFVGDYFTKKFVDMSLIDCIKVAVDLRSADADKIVTNAYSDADKTAFSDELKKQLFLKSDVPLDTDAFLQKMLGSLTGKAGEENSGGSDDEAGGLLYRTVHTLNASGAEENNDGLMEYLSGLFVRENMDLERLGGYDETKHAADYVLNLTDKELAATMNSALNLILDGSDLGASLAEYGIEDLTDIVALEQMIFERQTVGESEVPVLKLTLSLNARSAANSVISKSGGPNLSFLYDLLLPKRLYLTAQVSLQEGVTLDQPLFVNNMNDAKMDRVYSLVKGISHAVDGGDWDVKKSVNDKIGETMTPVLQKLNEFVPTDSVGDHAMRLDVFGAVLEVSGINKDLADPITAPDLIATLAGVVASDADKGVDSVHAWDHQYREEDGTVVYDPARADQTNLIDYRSEFMNELADKYLLNLSGDPDDAGDDVTFDDLLTLFGITAEKEGGSESKIELLDLFDKSKLHAALDKTPDQLRVNLNDRMLGAILDAQLSSLMQGDSTLASLSPKLVSVKLSASGEGADAHSLLTAGIAVDIGQLLAGSASSLSSVLTGLVGTKAVMNVTVDVTVTDDPEFAYLPGELTYNDRTKAETDKILETVNKLTGGFDVAGVLSSVEEPMRSGISAMSKVLPVKLCDSSVIGGADLPAAVRLPGIFEAIDIMLFKDDPDHLIDAQSIEAVLKSIDRVNDAEYVAEVETRNPPAENYDGFTSQLRQKYYLADSVSLDFDSLFVGDNKIIDSANFAKKLGNFDLARWSNDYTTLGASHADEKPVFADNEIAKMLSDKLGSEGTFAGGFTLREFSILNADVMKLTVELNLTSVLGEGNADKLRLLPADKLYFTATIDRTRVLGGAGSEYYGTDLQINDMDAATLSAFRAIVASLTGGAGALDFDAKTQDIGRTVYTQLDALASSLGGDALTFAADSDSGAWGIQLPSFLDFVRGAQPALSELTEQQVIEALQLLQTKS